ncbi:hypothetical protein D1AOALGA4SA_6330 [Olavius algarvensis Delta 1 endosymbiont]|nr:hypothetical protein D1AOALGA4SA_6330 [Olavius algarvensis Delta 1 endosymbiont]
MSFIIPTSLYLLTFPPSQPLTFFFPDFPLPTSDFLFFPLSTCLI